MQVPPGGERLAPMIQGLRADGVDVLVSLLTPDQIEDLRVTAEPEVCAANDIEFLHHPIVDHNVPTDPDATIDLARGLLERLEAGKGVVAHCYAGIGRSGTILAITMLLAGFELDDACTRISQARGIPCPETVDQMLWLRRLVESGKLRN